MRFRLPLAGLFLAVAAIPAAALPAAAQYTGGARTIEPHAISDPEGSLMGYYSALLIFAPDGAPSPARAWTIDLGANLGYVPPLSYDQRTAGRDKPEATNVTEVFGYPKVTVWFPYHIGFTAAATIPVEVNGATPHTYAFSLEGLAAHAGPVALIPRLTYTGGYIQGAITCNPSLGRSADSSFVFYYNTVCNGRPSTDKLEPDQWTLELDGTMPIAGGKVVPFAGIGVVRYDTRFDIQVQTGSGIDPDHPILTMSATKGYGMLGATWIANPAWRFGGSLFWAPGSVFTGRLSITLRLNDRG